MDDDWDLHAVVRGCAAASTSTSTILHSSQLQPDYNFPKDLFVPIRQNIIEDLHDLYKPFFPNPSKTQIPNFPLSPLSVLAGFKDLSSDKPPQQQIQKSGSQNSTQRSKKRKNHLKRVCHVLAEKLSSDLWSWRKYGQKPIKGSPYPRGYYRCSTSKGCMARRQVERNKSDPGMFIVTYTGDHNHPRPTHRNSLAGSTRLKAVVENPTSDEPKMSPQPENLSESKNGHEEDGDDLSVSDLPLDDCLFTDLEDLVGGGESGISPFPAIVGCAAVD